MKNKMVSVILALVAVLVFFLAIVFYRGGNQP